MTEKALALQLADALEVDKWHISGVTAQSAADELRRLHEAMRIALGHIMRGEDQAGWVNYAMCVDQARNVLRAALKEKNNG